jgi:hypothetical protein
MRSGRGAHVPALLVSIAVHAALLAAIFALDSRRMRRAPPEPLPVELVSGENERAVAEPRATAAPPARSAPAAAFGEAKPAPAVQPGPAVRPSARESIPPPREPRLSHPNPDLSIVAFIERCRRGGLARDSTWAGLDRPEERAREIAFARMNASFRRMRSEIEAERFLEAFRENFPYMK